MFKKESIRYILVVTLIFIATIILFNYSIEYINHNELNFSKEDSFILFLFATLFFLVIITAAYLNYRFHKIIYLVQKIQEEMADIEDNIIETNSTQYYTIIGMLDKISRGQNINEKKSAISSDAKMDREK